VRGWGFEIEAKGKPTSPKTAEKWGTRGFLFGELGNLVGCNALP